MTAVSLIVVGSGEARAPEGVAEVVRIGSVKDLLNGAREAQHPLLWLLDASAIPTASALAALLERAPGPVASLPVDRAGRPHEELLGGFGDGDIAGLLEAVGESMVPLRHLPLISLLAARDDVVTLAPPDQKRFGPYAGTEWTARLFARSAGFLVPASQIVVDDVGRPSAPLAALALVRSGTWRRTDALRPLRLAVNRLLEKHQRP